MFVVLPDGEVEIMTAGRAIEAPAGSKIIALVSPDSLFILKMPQPAE